MNVFLLALVLVLVAPQPTQAVRWASDTQGQAFGYGPFPQVASGGFGAGKTWLYCMKALWLSDTFPKNRGVIARRVAKELRATTMATFYKVCPPSAYVFGRRNDNEGYLKLNNGSEILFVHFEDPERQALLRGLEINWFLIDQAEEAPETMEEVFDVLLARLSRWDMAEVPQWLIDQHRAETGREWDFVNPESGKPMPPPYPMLAVNPDIELHWVYRRFHPESAEHREPKIPELDSATGQPTGRVLSYHDLGYRMFHMPSLENRFLADQNKQALLSKDAAFIKRYVLGEWGLPEGAIHVIPPESLVEGSPELLAYLRASCTLHRFMDHGESSPTCCLWAAVDKNGNIFAYREYYLPNALISTHRQNITELSVGEHYGSNQADPSIFHRRQRPGAIKADNNKEHGGLWCVADDYCDVALLPKESAIYWTPADNNELGTRNRINEYLTVDPNRVHPLTNQKGSPRMFFLKANDRYPQGLMHVIRETRSQRRVKVGSDLGRPIFSDERDPDVTDHGYDVLRYLVASRPLQASEQGPAAAPNTFFGQMQLASKKFKRRG